MSKSPVARRTSPMRRRSPPRKRNRSPYADIQGSQSRNRRYSSRSRSPPRRPRSRSPGGTLRSRRRDRSPLRRSRSPKSHRSRSPRPRRESRNLGIDKTSPVRPLPTGPSFHERNRGSLVKSEPTEDTMPPPLPIQAPPTRDPRAPRGRMDVGFPSLDLPASIPKNSSLIMPALKREHHDEQHSIDRSAPLTAASSDGLAQWFEREEGEHVPVSPNQPPRKSRFDAPLTSPSDMPPPPPLLSHARRTFST
jgi:hypothetical protein